MDFVYFIVKEFKKRGIEANFIIKLFEFQGVSVEIIILNKPVENITLWERLGLPNSYMMNIGEGNEDYNYDKFQSFLDSIENL